MLVSTATKSLQDQLFLRDLPRLRDALGVPVALALLKGRASYLCLHRLRARRARSAALPDRFAVRTLAKHRAVGAGHAQRRPGRDRRPGRALAGDPAGDLDARELPGQRLPAVPRLPRRCKARREAMAADLVVVNHHLFFADLALRDTGMAELLPTVERGGLRRGAPARRGRRAVPRHAAGHRPGDRLRARPAGRRPAAGARPAPTGRRWPARCERAARDLRLAAAGALREVRGMLKLRWDERAGTPAISSPALDARGAAPCGGAPRRSSTWSTIGARLRRAGRAGRGSWRAGARASRRRAAAAACAGSTLRRTRRGWSSRRWTSARCLREQTRRARRKAWIFTSATLGDDDAPDAGSPSRPGWRMRARCAWAARSTMRPTRALYVPRGFPEAERAGAPGGGGARWRRAAPRRWAAAPSC